jgi:maltose-binding protein MalE
MRDQLIVRASPRKLREIKTLLEKIDAQLTNLQITVKQGFRSQLNKMEQEIEVAIPIGEAGRVIINPGDKGD